MSIKKTNKENVWSKSIGKVKTIKSVKKMAKKIYFCFYFYYYYYEFQIFKRNLLII